MKDYMPLMQTALWVILALTGLLAFRTVLTERIRSGVSIKIGPVEFGEIVTTVRAVEHRLDEVSDRVSKLFLLTMATNMFTNLMKLASGDFGPYEMSGGLKRELYHLRDVGYIAVESISAIPDRGPNLSEHVQVTIPGLEFVRLREQVSER